MHLATLLLECIPCLTNLNKAFTKQHSKKKPRKNLLILKFFLVIRNCQFLNKLTTSTTTTTTPPSAGIMAKKFFPDEWEKLSKEEMINARSRLAGFIESTTEKEKTIRDVSTKMFLSSNSKLTFVRHLKIRFN